MRKFFGGVALDPETFDPTITLRYKDENNKVHVVVEKEKYEESNDETLNLFTPQECKKINTLNNILRNKGQDEMTIDEMKYYIDPTGVRWRAVNDINGELQRLSGFAVKNETSEERIQTEDGYELRTVQTKKVREFDDSKRNGHPPSLKETELTADFEWSNVEVTGENGTYINTYLTGLTLTDAKGKVVSPTKENKDAE